MKKRNTTVFDGPDRLNVLVEGTRVKGDIVMESSIRIDGEVVGNLASSAKVVVGKNGTVKGDLNCSEADIEGRIEGVIKVEDLLILRANARVNGDIKCSRIQIEDGAQFTGKCIMSNVQEAIERAENTVDLVY